MATTWIRFGQDREQGRDGNYRSARGRQDNHDRQPALQRREEDLGRLDDRSDPHVQHDAHGPQAGQVFHDKGRGNGYVLTYGGTRIYISGDTEGIPEMRALKNIDVAFICMNLPYTMTPEEAADAVKAFHPKVAIPYHYSSDPPDDDRSFRRTWRARELKCDCWIGIRRR